MWFLIAARLPTKCRRSWKPAADALDDVLGRRDIYVYYPSGMGQSKLRIPAARLGTARNLNTVAKLVEMSARNAKEP